jgi:hypothetical protein
VITPTLGSIVQNGKLAACAFALLRQLKRVDLPTLGNPTIPHFKAMRILKNGGKYSDSEPLLYFMILFAFLVL